MWIIRYYRHLWKQREELKGIFRRDSEFDWLFNNIPKAYHFHSMLNISCLVLSFTLRLILTIIHIQTEGSETNYVKITSTQYSLTHLNPASCSQTLVYCSHVGTRFLFEPIKAFRKNQDKTAPPSLPHLNQLWGKGDGDSAHSFCNTVSMLLCKAFAKQH